MTDKRKIPLGTSEAGIIGIDNAAELAENIATTMSTPFVEEPTIHHKL